MTKVLDLEWNIGVYVGAPLLKQTTIPAKGKTPLVHSLDCAQSLETFNLTCSQHTQKCITPVATSSDQAASVFSSQGSPRTTSGDLYCLVPIPELQWDCLSLVF